MNFSFNFNSILFSPKDTPLDCSLNCSQLYASMSDMAKWSQKLLKFNLINTQKIEKQPHRWVF